MSDKDRKDLAWDFKGQNLNSVSKFSDVLETNSPFIQQVPIFLGGKYMVYHDIILEHFKTQL